MASRLENLKKMCDSGSNDPFPFYALALEYRSQDDVDSAITTFERLRKRFPEYVPQYLMAGQLLASVARRDEAREWLTAGVAAARAAQDSHAQGEIEGALAGLQ